MKQKIFPFVFLGILMLFLGLFYFPSETRASLDDFKVYFLITTDTTPTIRGTMDSGDVGSISITVTIEGGSEQEVTDIEGDGDWNFPITDEMETGSYDVVVRATLDPTIRTTTLTNGLFILENTDPFNLYWYGQNGSEVEYMIFPQEFTFSSGSENFSIVFPAGTQISKEGGGTFDPDDWYMDGVDPSNERILVKLRFGVPDIGLAFSNNVTINFDVGSEYNGETLYVFTKSDGVNDDGWEQETTCVISEGICSFNVSHASYFAVSEFNSIAETEEGIDEDNDNDKERAYIKSWKAYRYSDPDKLCSNRLRLEIKGKHFDDDAVVKIGNHKASSVEKKSSKKLVAKFCMDKLLKAKTDHEKIVSVKNPHTKIRKADEEIDLDNIGYNFSEDEFDLQAVEGVKNIQTKLVELGFLGEQYITGFFGPITTEATKKFQEKNSIPTTGYVGPLTRAKLASKK